MNIRSSIKAIIIKDNKILTMKARDDFGYFYLLPGGGQKNGETMFDALKRECLEEINCNIEIFELLLIREYIGKNHEFEAHDSDVHQIEHMFRCRILNNETPVMGTKPDKDQVGIEWLDIDSIENYRLYPQNLRKYMILNRRTEKIYYGDVN